MILLTATPKAFAFAADGSVMIYYRTAQTIRSAGRRRMMNRKAVRMARDVVNTLIHDAVNGSDLVAQLTTEGEFTEAEIRNALLYIAWTVYNPNIPYEASQALEGGE